MELHIGSGVKYYPKGSKKGDQERINLTGALRKGRFSE